MSKCVTCAIITGNKAQGATFASKVLMLEIHLLALIFNLWEGTVYKVSFTAYTGLHTSINLEQHNTSVPRSYSHDKSRSSLVGKYTKRNITASSRLIMHVISEQVRALMMCQPITYVLANWTVLKRNIVSQNKMLSACKIYSLLCRPWFWVCRKTRKSSRQCLVAKTSKHKCWKRSIW